MNTDNLTEIAQILIGVKHLDIEHRDLPKEQIAALLVAGVLDIYNDRIVTSDLGNALSNLISALVEKDTKTGIRATQYMEIARIAQQKTWSK